MVVMGEGASQASTQTTNSERTLARIRAALSLALLDAERFQHLMESHSGDVEELQKISRSIVSDLELIEERSKTLDPHDPSLIVPREIVTSLASQARSGNSLVSEWLESRKGAAMQAIQVGIAQGKQLGNIADAIELSALMVEQDNELDVTYTTQVQKKRKVFSDGKLIVSGYHVRLNDSFGCRISSIDLRGSPEKRLMFLDQYNQAALVSPGYLQGVLEGVIVCVDFPTESELAEALVEKINIKKGSMSIVPVSGACQSVEVSANHKGTGESIALLPKIPVDTRNTFSNFCPLSVGGLKKFVPVLCVSESMSLYDRPHPVIPPDTTDSYFLRIINLVYEEIFRVVSVLPESSAACKCLRDIQWRVELRGAKFFVVPITPAAALPKRTSLLEGSYSYDLIAFVPKKGSGQILLVYPIWAREGLMEVLPVSHETVEFFGNCAKSGVCAVNVSLAWGVEDLHGDMRLVEEVKARRLNNCLPNDILDIQAGRGLQQRTTSLDTNLQSILSKLALSDQQVNILRAVAANWLGDRDDNPNVMAVEGVFGSGKSTLLAACILLVSANAKSSATTRVYLIAATNAAVDAVLIKLIDLLNCFKELGVSADNVTRVGVVNRIDPTVRKYAKSTITKKTIIVGSTAAYVSQNGGEFGPSGKSTNEPPVGYLFIDEAAQMSEIVASLPVLRIRPNFVFLVGDPLQLQLPLPKGIKINSILDVALGNEKHLKYRITHQFRCHPTIASICSNLFYNPHGIVIESPSIASHGVIHGSCDWASPSSSSAVQVITHNGNSTRSKSPAGSLVNLEEIALIESYLSTRNAQLSNCTVMVISHYCGQVELLKERLSHTPCYADVQVHTVDSCQGSEADVVLFSVTASHKTSFEFIGNANRLNVALSRAIHKVVIFGNSVVFEKIPFYKTIKQGVETQ